MASYDEQFSSASDLSDVLKDIEKTQSKMLKNTKLQKDIQSQLNDLTAEMGKEGYDKILEKSKTFIENTQKTIIKQSKIQNQLSDILKIDKDISKNKQLQSIITDKLSLQTSKIGEEDYNTISNETQKYANNLQLSINKQKEIKSHLNDILKNEKDINKNKELQNEIDKTISNLSKIHSTEYNKILIQSNSFVGNLQSTIDKQNKIKSQISDILKSETGINKSKDLQLIVDKKLLELTTNIGKKGYNDILENANIFKDNLKETVKIQEILKSKLNEIKKIRKDEQGFDIPKTAKEKLLIEEATKRTNEQIQSLYSRMGKEDYPLIVEQAKLLGKDLQNNAELQDRIFKKTEEFTKDSLFSEWGKKIKSTFNDITVAAQNPMIAWGLFAATATKDLIDIGSGTLEMRKELSLSGDEALNIGKNLYGASAGGFLLGVSLADNKAAMTALVNKSNGLKLATTDNIKAVAKLSSWYGVAAEDSVTLLSNFKKLNNGSEEAALSSLEFAKNLAVANKIPVNKLMSEVASDTNFFAKYAKDGGKNLVIAAASALKLGIGMSEIQSISDSFMDVGGSIEKEMNASVLLGKQINFQKARELAFQGDLEGMTKEVVSQLGNINEWDKLNIIQKQALADSVGVEVSALQTMIANQEELNLATAKGETFWGKIGLSVSGIKDNLIEHKDTLFASVNALASMKQILPSIVSGFKSVGGFVSNMGSKISGVFKGGKTSGAVKLLEKQKVLEDTKPPTDTKGMEGQAKKNPLVTWINSWGEMDKKALGKFALASLVMIASLAGLGLALMVFNNVGWQAAITGMSSMLVMAGIMYAISKMNKDILAGSVGMLIMSTSLIAVGYGLQQFTGLDWKGLTAGGVALVAFTGLVFGLGALLFAGGGMGAMLFGAGVLGFIALGASLQVLGKGMQMIATPFATFVPLLNQLVVIAPMFSTIGLGFAAMGAGLMTMSVGLLAIAPLLPVLATLTALGSLGTSLFGGEESKTETTGTKEKDKMDILIGKMDTLISVVTNGTVINVDKRNVAKVMGLVLDGMNTYPQ
jgi:hypothetical protein